MTLALTGAAWRGVLCHWVSCHAHDNDNDIKWGSYVPHMSLIYGVKSNCGHGHRLEQAETR
jgi:hypothetical protein